MILALLATISMSSAQVQFPPVVDRAKALLSGLGEPGPFRLQSMFTTPRYNGGKATTVKLLSPSGIDYTAWFHLPETDVSICRGSEAGSAGMRPTRPDSDPKIARKIELWLHSIHADTPHRTMTITSDRQGTGFAYVALTSRGYPYISAPGAWYGPTYGYEFTFDYPSMRIRRLDYTEHPPPTDPSPARLDQSQATSALARVIGAEYVPQGAQRSNSRWFSLLEPPVLGYYQSPGRAMATVAWKFSYMAYGSSPGGVRGGSGQMLIDALTGEQVPSNPHR